MTAECDRQADAGRASDSHRTRRHTDVIVTPESQRIGRRRGFLVLVATVQMLMMLGTTVVMVSLPALRDAFGLSVAELQWVVTSYNLGFGGLLLVGGRLADIFGQRRILATGIVILLLGSLLAGLAVDEVMLAVTRGAQGLGAALASPAALSLLTTVFSRPRERSIALGIWAASGATGAALGNVVGGLVTSLFGWRWVFILTVPVCVILLALVPVLVPRTAPRIARGSQLVRGLKLGSGLLITSSIALLIYALAEIPRRGLLSTPVVVAGCAAVLLGIVFVVVQARSDDPMLNLSILRSRSGVGFVLIMLGAGIGVGPYYVASLFMQEVMHLTSLAAGLMFLPWCLMIIVGAQLASRMLLRVGARITLATGFAIAGAGTAVLALLANESMSFIGGLIVSFALVGLGGGMAGVSATTVAMSEVPARLSGVAAGVANGSGQIGGALSVAVLALIVTFTAGGGTSASPDGSAIRAGLWCATGLAVAGLAVSSFFAPGRGARRESRSAAVATRVE